MAGTIVKGVLPYRKKYNRRDQLSVAFCVRTKWKSAMQLVFIKGYLN